jgi:lipopolysaccharide export system permease protein
VQPAVQPPVTRPFNATVGFPPSAGINVGSAMELSDASMRLNEAERLRNSYSVEIEKKFSLAAACIVFVIVGAPIALRFPRGGVGLVISVSFAVFGIYYVGLIGGESLADKGIIPPFWAMWGTNVIFLVLGVLLMLRMGNEGVTARGGSLGEVMDSTRAWFAKRGFQFGAGRRTGDGA